MTEVLLKELSNGDLDWLIATGCRRDLAAGTQLMRAGEPLDSLHVSLDGNLVSTLPQIDDNPLARAFAALEEKQSTGVEIARLSSGEVVGETTLIAWRVPVTTVTAVDRAQILSIPLLQLETKLEADIGFAARFYRAIAILLANRLESIIDRLGRTKLAPDNSIKDVLFVFGELNDSDLDWLIANGERQKITVNTTLIRQGCPIDALYILLSGRVSLSIIESDRNPLKRIFATIEDSSSIATEIAKISKGSMLGATVFIDGRLPYATATATEDTIALSLSRSLLSAKLHHGVGFASRFYRTVSALLADRLQGMLARLAHSRRMYHQSQSLDEKAEYADELNTNDLEQIAAAGKRFNWILEQLKVG